MAHEVYLPEEILAISRAVDTVVRDDLDETQARREKVARVAIRLSQRLDVLAVDELVALMRAEFRGVLAA
jgi:hypothetical protein